MRKHTLFVLLCLFALAVISACAPTAAPPAAPPAATAAPGAATAAPAAATTASEQPTTAATTGKKPYKAVLINNFMGNSWRTIMERSAQLLIKKPPLEGRIESVRFINTENTPQAQNVALNSVTLEKPDMILFDAASASASNQALKAACDAGIKVISFDILVDEPCAWKINQDWKAAGRGWAQFIADQIGGKGVVLQDLGQAGASSSRDMVEGENEVLAKYPDIKLVTYYSEFAPGTEESAVSTLLAANPQVDAVLSHGPGYSAIYAFEKAGRKPVPWTGFSYNEGLLQCQKWAVPCLLKSQGPWVSGAALRLGADILDGTVTGEPRLFQDHQPWFTDDKNFKPEEGDVVLPVTGAGLADQPGGLLLPLSPPWAELDAKEVLQPPDLGQ